MRAEPDKLENVGSDEPIDQNQVGPNMAVAMILLFPDKTMIAIASRQGLILNQELQCRPEKRFKFLADYPRLFAPIIPLETRGMFNRPH